MADWSMLPSDILGGIALKLDFIEDFIHFSAVCFSWNHVFYMVKPEWSRARKPTPPWLLLAEPKTELELSNKDTTEEKLGCRRIFSVRNNKCYEMMLPQITGKRCWGSSYGWIVMFGSDEDVQLFNPITKAHLSLPSLKTMPNYPVDCLDGDGDSGSSDFDFGFIEKDDFDHWVLTNICVLKMPQKDNVDDDFIVLMVGLPDERLAFARPGDRAWTEVVTEGKTGLSVYHVVCWKGKVLILHRDTTFAYCDIEDLNQSVDGIPVKAKNYCNLAPVNNIVSADYFPELYDDAICSMYIVELNGDLLAVVRNREYSGRYPLSRGIWYRTIKFEVYKHVESWEKVEDLGDFLIFVGYNYASAVDISKAPNCQQNAIYFVDDEYYDYTGGIYKTHGHDMGIFDMATGEITPFYNGGDTISEYFSAIWFLPNF